jgi:hypothetical protein
MKKLTCVLAILAAASTAAMAKDLKQDKKATAPAVAATEMTDAEMDKVTAGGWIELGPNANVTYNPINGPVEMIMYNTGPNPGGTITIDRDRVGTHCLTGPCSP